MDAAEAPGQHWTPHFKGECAHCGCPRSWRHWGDCACGMCPDGCVPLIPEPR